MKDLATQFEEWVRTKPEDEAYDWSDVHQCACGQFATFLGWDGDLGCPLRAAIESGDVSDAAFQRPWTFGALAQRLSRGDRP